MRRTTAGWAGVVVLVAVAAAANTGPYTWASLPVPYRIYGHASLNGVPDFLDGGVRAVQRAFDAWTARGNPPVTCTSWAVSYQGTYSSSSGPAVAPSDGHNSVLWLTGSAWPYGSGVLVHHSLTYSTSTQRLLEVDVELNGNYQWAAGSPTTSQYDIETAVVGRAGYFFGAEPSAGVATSLLNGQPFQLGVVRTALGPSDVTDVCTMYPGDGGTSTPPRYDAGIIGEFCRFCRTDAECSSGLCVSVDARTRACSAPCVTSTDCGPGFLCANNARGTVCVSQAACTGQCSAGATCGPGFTCNAGRCEATGAVGDPCDVTTYCEPCAVCVFDGAATRCSRCCNGVGSCSGCGGGSSSACTAQQRCGQLPSGAAVCVAVDAGIVVDSGVPVIDAGSGPDAGSGADAGGPVDAGGAVDAGTPPVDAGQPGVDAGTDAGVEEDAGTGSSVDAGSTARRDAGTGNLPTLPADSCGCDAGGGAAVLLALLALGRRRRGLSRQAQR